MKDKEKISYQRSFKFESFLIGRKDIFVIIRVSFLLGSTVHSDYDDCIAINWLNIFDISDTHTFSQQNNPIPPVLISPNFGKKGYTFQQL